MSLEVFRTLEQLATVGKDAGKHSTLHIGVQRSTALWLLWLGKVAIVQRGRC